MLGYELVPEETVKPVLVKDRVGVSALAIVVSAGWWWTITRLG